MKYRRIYLFIIMEANLIKLRNRWHNLHECIFWNMQEQIPNLVQVKKYTTQVYQYKKVRQKRVFKTKISFINNQDA